MTRQRDTYPSLLGRALGRLVVPIQVEDGRNKPDGLELTPQPLRTVGGEQSILLQLAG